MTNMSLYIPFQVYKTFFFNDMTHQINHTDNGFLPNRSQLLIFFKYIYIQLTHARTNLTM